MENEFLNLDSDDREKYFYDVRKEYNSYKISEKELSTKRAAEFIFLNRTCFNGLYRVNRKGEFMFLSESTKILEYVIQTT